MPASTSSSGKVLLITGANKGIGYEAAKLLAQKLPHATILLGTRTLDNGHKAIQRMKEEGSSSGGQHTFDNVKPIELDVITAASIDKAAQQVKSEYGSLDVLMCNAGVAGSNGETAETIFAVNVGGVHDTIEAFLPIIPAASGSIVVVTSEVAAWATDALPSQLQQKFTSIDSVTWPLIQQLQSDWLKAHKGEAHEQPWPDTNNPGTGAYSISKALINAHLRSFALTHQQPKLVITCPGYCATDLNHNSGTRPASEGGESVCWPLLHPAEAKSGQFYQDGHELAFVKEAPDWAKEAFKRFAEELAAKSKQAGQ